MARSYRLFALFLSVLLILTACAQSAEEQHDEAASVRPGSPEAAASEEETEAEQFRADYLPQNDSDGKAETKS